MAHMMLASVPIPPALTAVVISLSTALCDSVGPIARDTAQKVGVQSKLRAYLS